MSLEERMSKTIIYNLTILSSLVKPTEQFKEVLQDGLFLRSNTSSFIHVTHHIFNILDQKEFKKKFYWPITDKKSESSYRTNSVEFTNMLIDKYKIPNQDKIKQVTVVHPYGKKFMSLVLSLIGAALKEIMRREKISPGCSLDLEKTSEVVETISKLESDIIGNIKSDMKTIKDKTAEIQQLINSIYPSDENSMPFKDFIEYWHALNKTRLANLKARQEKVNEIYRKSKILQDRAKEMLTNKNYEIVQPSSEQIKELTDFYQHVDMPIDNELNIVSLILHLEKTLPIIQNFIRNFSYNEVEISEEEMKIVKKKLVELHQLEPLIKKLKDKEKEFKEKIANLRLKKEQRESEASQSVADDKMYEEAQEKEALRLLMSPKYSFDASKNSMNCFNFKKNHLIFETDDHDRTTSNLNQSRLYRPLSDTTLNKSRDFALMQPPRAVNKKNKPPSRRRHRDPMQLMEQAISSGSQNRLAANVTYNAGIATSTPFSSTMYSPDVLHNPNFSNISSVYMQTPLTHFSKVTASSTFMVQPVAQKSSQKDENQLWNEGHKVRKLQRSPAIMDVTVSADETIMALRELDGNALNVPKLHLNDETVQNNVFESSSEPTICKRDNFGGELDVERLEEDLFNVSDTILVEND